MTERPDLLAILEETDLSRFERSPFDEAAANGDKPLARPSWLIDAADLLAQPDPGPTPWLVEDLIVDQALIAAVGRWKTTKSYGMLDLCIAIATGRPAFGALTIPNPGPVVFVNEESGQAALWRRLDALCRGRAINPEELRGRLHLAANARAKLDDPHWQNELLALGRELRPRLFCFDPLARMKAPDRDESAQLGMASVIEFWRQLRAETAAAVALVHHTGHTGNHMRGSSDLESAWETRLAWKRDGQSQFVTIESEHREAEAAGTIEYRIDWDHDTRSMRFELQQDDQRAAVEEYLHEHPEASANEVYKEIGGKRVNVLAEVKRYREEGGSLGGNHPGTTPLEAPSEGGSPAPLYRGLGTTLEEPGSHDEEPPVDEAEVERLAALLDDGDGEGEAA
jgi:hypothetical protein